MSKNKPPFILQLVDARRRATIVRAADGGPIRRILPGARTTPVGVATSRKVGRPMSYESPVEKAMMHVAEIDPAVVSFMMQPHRIEFLLDGEIVRYDPDMELLLADGTTLVREGKDPRDRRLRDPRYVRKLEAAARIYEDLGWRVEIVWGSALLGSRTARVAAAMWANRHVSVASTDLYEISALVETGAPTRSDLIGRLGGGRLGEARLDALAIRRVLTWDDYLERLPNSLCRSVGPDERPIS